MVWYGLLYIWTPAFFTVGGYWTLKKWNSESTMIGGLKVWFNYPIVERCLHKMHNLLYDNMQSIAFALSSVGYQRHKTLVIVLFYLKLRSVPHVWSGAFMMCFNKFTWFLSSLYTFQLFEPSDKVLLPANKYTSIVITIKNPDQRKIRVTVEVMGCFKGKYSWKWKRHYFVHFGVSWNGDWLFLNPLPNDNFFTLSHWKSLHTTLSNLVKMAEKYKKWKKNTVTKGVTNNFFFSYSVFNRFVLQTRKNQSLLGKG